MVFGECSRSRPRLSEYRSWYLGSSLISEKDSVTHLGIVLSVSPSLIDHSSKCIMSARSAFYSLQGVGSRFGCLHVCTSLKVFKSISLPLLLYGFEVLFPPNSLFTMLDRCQLCILRVILGLPDRVSTIAIHHLTGTLPFKLLVYKAHMSLYRLLALPDDAIFIVCF